MVYAASGGYGGCEFGERRGDDPVKGRSDDAVPLSTTGLYNRMQVLQAAQLINHARRSAIVDCRGLKT